MHSLFHLYGKKVAVCHCNAIYTYYELTPLTDTSWLCARPLPIGLTGPGDVSCQKVFSVTAEGDHIIVVPPPVKALSITWCGGHTACDNCSKRYMLQLNATHIDEQYVNLSYNCADCF